MVDGFRSNIDVVDVGSFFLYRESLLLNSFSLRRLQRLYLVENGARELVRGGFASHVARARLAVNRGQFSVSFSPFVSYFEQEYWDKTYPSAMTP